MLICLPSPGSCFAWAFGWIYSSGLNSIVIDYNLLNYLTLKWYTTLSWKPAIQNAAIILSIVSCL